MTGLPASLRLPRKPPGTASQGFGRTSRIDDWATEPGIVAFGFTAFIVYSLFSALLWYPLFGVAYEVDGYLSPFFSPLIHPDWMPTWFSPAILILWIPLGFRTTCYYYRKAYYRSFWGAPPACAVTDVRPGYTGETRFPLIFQNLHRYTFYVAVLFIVVLAYDALLAFRFPGGRFGIGVGTLVMWLNVVFLAGYTFSCHSCRHLCGGAVNQFSKAPTRYALWKVVTRLNERHPTFAWLSLFSVGLTDLYIRLVSMGVIRDLRIVF
jgi:hypothetical protein